MLFGVSDLLLVSLRHWGYMPFIHVACGKKMVSLLTPETVQKYILYYYAYAYALRSEWPFIIIIMPMPMPKCV